MKFETYFHDTAIKPSFTKEFISIFDGWLGKDNLHQIDDVTEKDWSRFNELLRLLSKNYDLYRVDLGAQCLQKITDIQTVLNTHQESELKQSAEFTTIAIPELNAIYAEDWDCTWILWHMNNGAVETLSPLIDQSGLFHWAD
ncbi:MAG: hypothetical protein ABJM26_07715 [Anderseniella sp.]|uniref:hypothetical protein n=1 Tax=Pseudomonadota TaxID=1224 RepID=UPI003272F146